jgi:hypothetical protein
MRGELLLGYKSKLIQIRFEPPLLYQFGGKISVGWDVATQADGQLGCLYPPRLGNNESERGAW